MNCRWLVVLLGLSARAALAQAQSKVVVRDPGPGPVGRYLAMTLAKPDTRVIIADTVKLTSDSTYPGSVVVIGRRAAVSGSVKGDVIVVGGDLFAKPGARVLGQGMAIGGGAYPSLLGSVRDGLTSYRDFTFDTARVNGVLELRYRELIVVEPESRIQLPGIYGLRIPSYDRSNGLSLPIGPLISLEGAKLTLEPIATYRSQIGQIDPSVGGDLHLSHDTWMHGFGGRETRSNDDWITGNMSNSINALLLGRDTRNWYRATAGNLFVNKTFTMPTVTATYRLGGQFERASSARPGLAPTGGPWSITGKHSDEGMLRGNPQIGGGDITSVIGGAEYVWLVSDIQAHLDLTGEVPVSITTGEHFAQLTVDGQVGFPTFGLQRYRFDVHAILTRGDTAPGQRFGYLGGAGTLSTVEPLLSIGGDELLFLENRYSIPVPALTLPFVGLPTVTFRHLLGTAAIQHLPALTQLIGVRVSLMLFRAEVMRDTKSGKTEGGVSLSLVR